MERAGGATGCWFACRHGQAAIRRQPAACVWPATRSARAMGRHRGRQGV